MAIDRDHSRRRRMALQHAAALLRVTAPGVRETSRIWRRMRAQLVRAPAEGVSDIELIIQQGMREAAPILANAMMVAWMMGVQQTIKVAAPKVAGVRLAYEGAISKLASGLTLSDAEVNILQQQFGTRALETLTLTGNAIEERLRPTVNKLIADGTTTRDAVKEMSAKVAGTGVGPTKNYQLEAIYRTQTQIANSNARIQAMSSPLIDSILWGWEYSTVGDDRVRDSHAAQDGTRRRKDDSYWDEWMPPNGWNCRCMVIEVYADEVEPTERIQPANATDSPDPGFDFDPAGVNLSGIGANMIVSRVLGSLVG